MLLERLTGALSWMTRPSPACWSCSVANSQIQLSSQLQFYISSRTVCRPVSVARSCTSPCCRFTA